MDSAHTVISESPSTGKQVVTVITPPRGWTALNLSEIWRYRDLLFLLVWRDVSARYRQSVIGYGWAIVKPVMMTAIFTVSFGMFLQVKTGKIPYALFTLTGQVPWMYFSGALATVSASVVGSSHMLTKVYFPHRHQRDRRISRHATARAAAARSAWRGQWSGR